MDETSALEGSAAELILWFFKHRWRPGGEAPAWAELDLDGDLEEVTGAVGRPALEAFALAALAHAGPLADEARAVRALAPELEPAAARAYLVVVAGNLAFRLRTDALLRGLLAACARPRAEGGLPWPGPEVAAALVARARGPAAARALVDAADLPATVRSAALAAAEARATLRAPDAEAPRLHVEASHDALERALAGALRPLVPASFAAPPPGARRLLLLRPRGGWVTVLSEDGALDLALARRLARAGGVRRVAWVGVDAAPAGEGPGPAGVPRLVVLEGARVALELPAGDAPPAAHPGPGAAPPAPGDHEAAAELRGALLALGVLDVDPEHPRRPAALRFADHVGGQPPLGLERRLRKHGARALCFAPSRA